MIALITGILGYKKVSLQLIKLSKEKEKAREKKTKLYDMVGNWSIHKNFIFVDEVLLGGKGLFLWN